MANISDEIAKFICSIFDEEESVKISRSELANKFDVSPSQINYVLSTRFCEENGYIIRSKRGESGYIAIIKLDTEFNPFFDIVKRIDKENGLTAKQVENYVNSMLGRNLINDDAAIAILAITSPRALAFSQEQNIIRKHLFREILLGFIDGFEK